MTPTDDPFPHRGAAVPPEAPHPVRTLPPPEWEEREGPRSVASLALGRHEHDPPISRRMGPRAELGHLRARLAATKAQHDTEAERAAAAALARALAARGTELDTATKLARRALLLGDDPAIREELAAWFAMLGEAALAAATLRPLATAESGKPAAALYLKMAGWLGRAGDAPGVIDSLNEAAREDASDPRSGELVGLVAAWAPGAIPAERAARAYLVAAERYEKRGRRAEAFENLLRAFDMDPGLPIAAERLSASLAGRGRPGAADEVSRDHARAVGIDGRGVHLARMRQASAAGDMPRAVAAAFDARLETELDVPSALRAAKMGSQQGVAATESPSFDELLERVGLFELVAARLELAADDASGRARAQISIALARVYSGPLGSPERAVLAWTDALRHDPGSEETRAALRDHAASTRDASALARALVQACEGVGDEGARLLCLRELALLAEQRLKDPALALWAAERLLELEPEARDARELVMRVEPGAREQHEVLAAARASLGELGGAERVEALRRIEVLVRGHPETRVVYLDTLEELRRLVPEDRVVELALSRALGEFGSGARIERALAQDGGREAERLRVALAERRRREGDDRGALAALRPMLREASAHPATISLLLVVASRVGDEVARAHALLRLSATLAPTFRALLQSVASEALLAAGRLSEARSAAEQAMAADPSLARPVAARAAIALADASHRDANVLERALGVVVPRAALCEALASAHETLGDPLLALAWTQRWLGLRPGEPRAVRALLERAIAHAEPARLGDALAWLLAQPLPLAEIDELVARALSALARLSPERAAALARRTLDELGPQNARLRQAVLSIADGTDEQGLAISVLERWLAASAPGADRPEALLDLARRRRSTGDVDGSARALQRAIEEGASASAVRAELEVTPAARGSDGEISVLEALAEALSALASEGGEGAGRAWREVGAARWDLAGDAEGAVTAWERALALDPERGVERFALDLVAFGGAEAALARLEDLASRRDERNERARVLAVAASVALQCGKTTEALNIAARALELDSSRADVLAVAERAAGDQDLEALDVIYGKLADAALGCYGERAAHYRAARQLERRGALERALAHATRAFEAVPAEGVSFVVMARLAERTNRTGEAIQVLERVAQRAPNAHARAEWLHRAAMLADTSEDGTRQRVEVLLRALAVRPDVETVRELGEALAALVALVPEEREVVELRFSRALADLRKLEGPEGARVCVAAARAGVAVLDSAKLALEALVRALECDASVDEYATLLPFTSRFANEPESARAFIGQVVGQTSNKFSNLGRALLEVAATLAGEFDDEDSRSRLLVYAARRDPDDGALVSRARLAAQRSGDPELLELMLEAVPAQQRVDALAALAESAEREGDVAGAVDALEKALADPALAADERREVVFKLRDLYGRAGRRAALERLLETELERNLDDEDRIQTTRDLAALFAARGDPARALAQLLPVVDLGPEHEDLLGDVATLAGQAGDRRRQAEVLGRLADLARDERQRLALLRELAALLDELGDAQNAFARWSEVLAIDSDDPSAFMALEREAEKRGDYEQLVEILGRRAGLASLPEDVRRIRLRRATVLEQRLGRPDDARAELEDTLTATGDHLSVLRVLADLDERLGAPLRAAPLWMRSSAIAGDRAEAEDLARRACEAYLAGGDVESARRVLDGLETWAQTGPLLELRVQIERRSENPIRLAEALEQLARSSPEGPARRAELLVEAAKASLSGGDRQAALLRAQRAARLAPRAPEPQLYAHWLSYLDHGAGSAEEARVTVAELRGFSGALDAEQAELRAFLLAEALDVAIGRAAALRDLGRAETEVGQRPLIALGLAERLGEAGDVTRALELFDIALAGDLRGMRPRGEVALAAARAAHAAGDLPRALQLLETASSDATTRAAALAEQAEVRAELVPVPPEPEPARREEPMTHSSAPPPDATARPASQPPVSASGRYRSAPPSLSGEFEAAVPPPPEAIPLIRESPRPPPPEVPSGVTPLARAVDLVFPPTTEVEAKFLDALARGSVEAGKELILQLENRQDRAHDLLATCRRVAALVPGDRWTIRKLYEAAAADRDTVYARAIDHVLSVFDPRRAPTDPPPLSEQAEQPEWVRAMLFRDVTGPAAEALALVWEGAERVFRRDPGSYGVTGLERVPPGAPSPIGRVYGTAVRLLGVGRTPLFQRRSAGAVTLSVALLAPPALILSGEVYEESRELGFHVGAMLAATLPQYVLLFGSPESQARAVLRALALAFGPPKHEAMQLAGVANLAEVLWESIPARSQRRLRELCDEPSVLNYDRALGEAQRAVRRAGLFVAGDLSVALRETCLDEGIAPEALDEPDGLSALCSSSPSISDLVRLATSPEYAETRWQPARSGNRHPSDNWATF